MKEGIVMSKIKESSLELIGQTPMLKLNRYAKKAGVKDAIMTAVRDAGPNACPPMAVGVGIGGTFEKCALMAKHALTRSLEERSEIPYVRELEEEMLSQINKTGIGPGGLGGTTTALAVNIETYPTHIAGLPVAVNICCHVNRHAVRVL